MSFGRVAYFQQPGLDWPAQSNTLFKDVQDVLLSAASHVLQSLEHAPLVAPIAKLTSNILAGVAQVRAGSYCERAHVGESHQVL